MGLRGGGAAGPGPNYWPALVKDFFGSIEKFLQNSETDISIVGTAK